MDAASSRRTIESGIATAGLGVKSRLTILQFWFCSMPTHPQLQ
jgi:hypothetical protein